MLIIQDAYDATERFCRRDLFATLGSLRSLSARGNRLRSLAPSALSGARALASLDLADNQLALCSPPEGAEGGEGGAGGEEGAGDAYAAEFGPTSPLQALLALRWLGLAGNRLAGVCADWRYVLLQLRGLDLTRNRFHTITVTDEDQSILSVAPYIRHLLVHVDRESLICKI